MAAWISSNRLGKPGWLLQGLELGIEEGVVIADLGAAHRHRTRGGEVGLRATACPAMRLAVDEHERQIHIVAGERLFGDRTLGLGEQRVQFTFEIFETTRVR